MYVIMVVCMLLSINEICFNLCKEYIEKVIFISWGGEWVEIWIIQHYERHVLMRCHRIIRQAVYIFSYTVESHSNIYILNCKSNKNRNFLFILKGKRWRWWWRRHRWIKINGKKFEIQFWQNVKLLIRLNVKYSDTAALSLWKRISKANYIELLVVAYPLM